MNKEMNNVDINVDFEEPSNRQALVSGESIKTLFGKISKALKDLKAIAFSGKYSDLTGTPTSLPANGGNADTVNNHTLYVDVPADAIFTDDNTTYTLTKSGSTVTLTGSDGSTTTITDSDTTYSAATTSANGLMTSDMVTKLNGISTGANKTTVDSAMSSTSTNPVQNKVINTALGGKANSSHTHTVSNITDFPDSLPASDVSDWAKADTKPTYTASEVGAAATSHAHGNITNAGAIGTATNKVITTTTNGVLTATTENTAFNKDFETTATNIKMNGTQSVGTSANVARADHIHPVDTSRASASNFTAHTSDTANPHGVTKAQVGLGSVPNVTTNDQTPTYTVATSNTALTSGEKISVAFGKISKAISSLISHLADSVSHVTAAERTAWNAKQNALTIDSALSSTSTNPVQNKVVNTALSGKANTSHTHNYAGSSSAGGDANTAIKLTTPRTIDGVSFDGSANITHYGVCSTAAATVAKTVAVSNFVLAVGAEVTVMFTATNTASNPTLNVNNTGAKQIMYRNAASNGTWAANRVYKFVYDGTHYEMIGDRNDNSTDRIQYDNLKIYAGTNGIQPYSLVMQDSNSQYQSLTTSGGTGTSKVFNTTAKFRLPSIVYLYSGNNTTTAGNLVSSTYAVHSVYPSMDLRYSCNCSTTTFKSYSDIYIKGTIDSDGYFHIVTDCITQTLESGYYYIYLGVMYSAYHISLVPEHPTYYYDGTDLIDYTRKIYGKLLSVSGKTISLKNDIGDVLSSVNTQDTTYGLATASANGLMSSTDKTKVDELGTASTWKATSDGTRGVPVITADYGGMGIGSVLHMMATDSTYTSIWRTATGIAINSSSNLVQGSGDISVGSINGIPTTAICANKQYPSSDANDVIETGVYDTWNYIVSNIPYTIGTLVVFHGGNFFAQLNFSYDGAFAYRTRGYGTTEWTAWVTVATTAYKPYVTGAYSQMQSAWGTLVNLGFHPSWVFISDGALNESSCLHTITSAGFTVPSIANVSATWYYMAFR